MAAAMCAMDSSVSSRPRRSASLLSDRFQMKIPASAARSAPITASSRFVVHQGGRERMRTSLGVRTMTAKPSMCGNGSLGRQFSVSMRQMPETSMSHPISTSPKASGQELASIGTIRDSHSSPSLSVEWLGDGRLRTTPLMRIGCPWYFTCTAARPCRSVRS